MKKKPRKIQRTPGKASIPDHMIELAIQIILEKKETAKKERRLRRMVEKFKKKKAKSK